MKLLHSENIIGTQDKAEKRKCTAFSAERPNMDVQAGISKDNQAHQGWHAEICNERIISPPVS